nr:hypothetical protein [Tanacetum cinerariifolium]
GAVEIDGKGRVVTCAAEEVSCIGVRTEGSEITDTVTLSTNEDWICETSN